MEKLEAFENIGGRESLVVICKIFYDKVYKHPWLKLYFDPIPQEYIEAQQVDFMQKVLGGENIYAGKTPPSAHRHIYVTDELFQIRQKLLLESFTEAHAHQELSRKWLELDQAFKPQIVRESPIECTERYSTEGILNFAKP